MNTELSEQTVANEGEDVGRSNLLIVGGALLVAAVVAAIFIGNSMKAVYLDEYGDVEKIGFNWLAASAGAGALIVSAFVCFTTAVIVGRLPKQR